MLLRTPYAKSATGIGAGGTSQRQRSSSHASKLRGDTPTRQDQMQNPRFDYIFGQKCGKFHLISRSHTHCARCEDRDKARSVCRTIRSVSTGHHIARA
eukprot:1266324-Rhodomonas_salina.2